MASFVLSFFPLDVLGEIWDLIVSVSEGFLTYSFIGLPCVFFVNVCFSFPFSFEDGMWDFKFKFKFNQSQKGPNEHDYVKDEKNKWKKK